MGSQRAVTRRLNASTVRAAFRGLGARTGVRPPAGSPRDIAPPYPTPTPSRTERQQTRRGVRSAPERAALVATTPPAARVPPLRLTPASPARVTALAAALTLQPKLSYLPNPSPLPSLSSFVFPLPSTPWGVEPPPSSFTLLLACITAILSFPFPIGWYRGPSRGAGLY